ncbi:50S ribosomal protein L23 [Candidatus Mycoplasma pogonae]
MNVNEIIKKPILTEKTHQQMQEGFYTFAVDRRSNKTEIKKAVEYIFDVKVVSINIFNVPKKPKKLGRFAGFTTAYKKAIVKLAEGNFINLYGDEEVVEAETTSEKAPKVKEKSEAELKAAAKLAAAESKKDEA